MGKLRGGGDTQALPAVINLVRTFYTQRQSKFPAIYKVAVIHKVGILIPI